MIQQINQKILSQENQRFILSEKMDHVKKYKKIINELILESFPKLKGKSINVQEVDTLKYRAHVMYNFYGFNLLISNQLRNFPLWKIKRIMIHELCHLEIFLNQGVIKTNLSYLIYLFSKSYRLKVERETNILMIKKGYGKLVLTTLNENKRKGLKYSLTEKEIKSLMKNKNHSLQHSFNSSDTST